MCFRETDVQVAVFGMGYVGTVTAAVLAELGHYVVGVERQAKKVARLQRGRAPFSEPGIDELLSTVIAQHALLVTTDPDEAQGSDVFLICVGTPSLPDGSQYLSPVQTVCDEIGSLLADTDGYPVVVLRSTVMPTRLTGLVRILEGSSGLEVGRNFGFATNPEFLREGSALQDFRHPPMTVIGAHSEEAQRVVVELYAGLGASVIATTCRTAMAVKYVSNAWHALKLAFANEVAVVGRALGCSGAAIMDIVTQDTVLNVSEAYLRPGFAYGGSCLPKDLAALLSTLNPAWVPVLDAIPRSNEQRIQGAVDSVLATGLRRIAVVGLSFKTGTDDLRESPYAKMIDSLLDAGLQVRIYDPDVPPSRAGDYCGFLASLEALRGWAEMWVLGKPEHLPEQSIPSTAVVMELAP